MGSLTQQLLFADVLPACGDAIVAMSSPPRLQPLLPGRPLSSSLSLSSFVIIVVIFVVLFVVVVVNVVVPFNLRRSQGISYHPLASLRQWGLGSAPTVVVNVAVP